MDLRDWLTLLTSPSGSLGEGWALLARGKREKIWSAQWPVEDVCVQGGHPVPFGCMQCTYNISKRRLTVAMRWNVLYSLRSCFQIPRHAHNIMFRTREDTHNWMWGEEKKKQHKTIRSLCFCAHTATQAHVLTSCSEGRSGGFIGNFLFLFIIFCIFQNFHNVLPYFVITKEPQKLIQNLWFT